MKLLSHWSPQIWVIAFLTVCAAVLRLWNLPNTLMFQGDQGRDALIVSQIFTQGDPVFIGPVSSVGNIYLGPIYYYFMLPFLWLTYPSPLGPAYAVAIVGILTVPLMFFLGRKLVGDRAAMISAFLLCFSALAVTYSRFSWNPNLAPVFGLLMVYGSYMAWQKNKYYWLLAAVSFGVLLQLHYVSLSLAFGAGLIWLVQVVEVLRQKTTKTKVKELRQLVISTVLSVLVLVVSLTPLILFDFRHDGLNRKAFFKLFTQEEILADRDQSSLVKKIAETAKGTHGRSLHLLFEHTFGQQREITTAMLVIGILVLAKVIKDRHHHTPGHITVAIYLVTTIIVLAMYNHSIFDHYILFALPIGFLALGIVLAWLSRWRWGALITIGWLASFLILNVQKLPLTQTTSSIYQMQTIVDSLETKLKPDEPYSLVLLAPSKDLYGQNYRYFLSTGPSPALPPERANEAETLVVINEEGPTSVPDLPIYEIVTFPEKRPSEVYTIPNGPQIWIFRKSST